MIASSVSSRRTVLRLGLGTALATIFRDRADAQTPPPAPPSAGIDLQNFSFDTLSAAMRQRATVPYVEPGTLPQLLSDLSYDQYRLIRFREDHAVWRSDPLNFQIQAFYPGSYYRQTTRIYVGDGKAFQPLNFTPGDFEYLAPLDPTAFEGVQLPGVAGFRLQYPLERPNWFDELVTFLGASYFRALATGNRYGLSARGLAINTATSVQEEFPRFSTFYVVKPSPGDEEIRLFAELDSPSLTGAYAFVVRPGPQTAIEVTARIYFRNEVERLGVAPLTSMFFFGENEHADRDDFRPEVHDSDGLALRRSTGEWLWRPLRNPESLALSYFTETSPKAFGLLQRDRDFSHYEDIEARYDLRPSLMIEPLGNWGRGVVQLVEIPTNSEANDNIVAFWVPDERPKAGSQYEFRYRMRWGLDIDPQTSLATVAGTFGGMGGNSADDTSPNRRFAIDFEGGLAAALPPGSEIDHMIDVAEGGRLLHATADRLPNGGWRLSIEVERVQSGPVEIRAKLIMLQRIISETWLYQWTGTL
ncbi:glucan biosynthesis protein G [Aurantimonas sp. MSK8Z-1]|uniref:glucan biosynthesis protein n=1 Tax=Mangrovibrevibacter kandeliae TaxID=2968473 RepID=UPI0021196998|nr:glucan biosynthesis protein G [Aurantimonas sp. MSK8Z-1]MCW4115940.1 glucan biosynthesis protein G [Aurantimonas sp. MSK8Z-1]